MKQDATGGRRGGEKKRERKKKLSNLIPSKLVRATFIWPRAISSPGRLAREKKKQKRGTYKSAVPVLHGIKFESVSRKRKGEGGGGKKGGGRKKIPVSPESICLGFLALGVGKEKKKGISLLQLNPLLLRCCGQEREK